MVRLDPAPCPEGRGLHVLAEVVGRQTDFVVAADGRIMHALALIYVLRAVPGVGTFKLIQHAVDRVEVLLVPDQAWRDAAAAEITDGLKARLGAELRVELRLLEEIPPEASGKHRYVVSRVPLPATLTEAAAAPIGGGAVSRARSA
jgi:phenylacetate-CoA ligase